FAVDGRYIFDGDLSAARFWPLDFDLSRIAGLLADFLIGCGLIFDVKLGWGVRFEEQHFRLRRYAVIDLVKDSSAEGKPFQVSGFAVGIGTSEDAFAFREAAKNEVRSDEEFFRELDDIVMTVSEHEHKLIEFGAIDAKLFP